MFADRTLGQQLQLAGNLETQKDLGMARRELLLGDQPLHFVGEIEQAYRVGHRRTRFADAFGDLLLGHLELLGQRAIAFRFLDEIQILALQVLDQRDLQGLTVGHIHDDDRHLLELGILGGTKAALPRDQLIPVTDPADEERLKDAALAYGMGQLFQTVGRNGLARLPRALVNLLDRNLLDAGLALGRRFRRRRVLDQRTQPASQSYVLTRHIALQAIIANHLKNNPFVV